MKPCIRFSLYSLTIGFLALLTVNPAWAQGNSHARIVRLSFVEGNVTIARPDVQGWAEAPVNTPIQEGFKLSTGENSFAEVQVENGGTFRLGQLSLLDFTALELAPDGGKINHLELHQGYATFHLLPSRLADSLQVGTPYGTLLAQGGAKFRVDLEQGVERVEVFHGAVEVQSNLVSTTLGKDEVLILQPGADQPTVVSQGISKDDWDQWVDDRDALQAVSPNGPSPENYGEEGGGVPYGWSDLGQYGTWSDVPGMGMGWIPGGVGPNWAPYGTGQWCWYPGLGYVWIGAEPWGWLPYHYGGWEFVPGMGWVWFPNALNVWSPSEVVWYTGPGWVGWRPRPHRPNGAATCHEHCGGGVVSTAAFRQGGLLTSRLMLPIDPTTGTRARQPGIPPAMEARLVGHSVSLPAAQSANVGTMPAPAPGEAGNPATAATALGSRHSGATNPNAAIVYDPQQDNYVNGHRPTPAQPSAGLRPGAGTSSNSGSNPSLIQPVPVTGRGSGGQSADYQGSSQASPSGNAFTRPAPSVPRSNPSESRGTASEGRSAGGHAGGESTSSGGHSSAPAPTSGGGHSGGGHPGGGGGGHR